MGLFGGVFKLLAVLILAVIGLGAYLYFTDYAVDATITDTGEDDGGPFVVVTPTAIPYDFKQNVDREAANFVCVGYEVRFHVQSQAYQVYAPTGDGRRELVYDSQSGVPPGGVDNNLRCSATGESGGLI